MTLIPSSSHGGTSSSVQDADPLGGSGSLWLDTAAPGHGVPAAARPLLVRNAAGDGWYEVSLIHRDATPVVRGIMTFSDAGFVLAHFDAASAIVNEISGLDANLHIQSQAGNIYLTAAAAARYILLNQNWGVDESGAEFFNSITAPTDGSINTSARKQWFDDTLAAPKIRFKQKDSGGTLTSGIAEVASPITSGALPTVSLVSGTGAQIIVARAAETVTPLATDGTANAATCQVQLSPDNVTYSTLVTVTASVAVNTVGSVTIPVNVRVPAGWYLKLTASHATIGTTTYW